MNRLTVEQLSCRRDGRVILKDLSLQVDPGGSLAIVGPSGSGKSTLILTLAGLLRPHSGVVKLDGEPVHPLKLGLVPQPVGLVPNLTALENVLVASYARRLDRHSAAVSSAAALDTLGLSAQHHRPVDELSGGQRQRVAVARALAPGPVLLLADEPTSELDAAARDLVIRAVFDIRDQGGIVALATNDPEIASLCDQSMVLDR